jgi:ankyrin repeat protein
MVQLLLKHYVNFAATNKEGMKALHHASIAGNIDSNFILSQFAGQVCFFLIMSGETAVFVVRFSMAPVIGGRIT